MATEKVKEKKTKSRTAKGKKDPCWDGYKAQGTKKKGGKTVPNCKPVK